MNPIVFGMIATLIFFAVIGIIAFIGILIDEDRDGAALAVLFVVILVGFSLLGWFIESHPSHDHTTVSVKVPAGCEYRDSIVTCQPR